MFDCSKNVLQKGVRSRVRVSICPGLTRNRMFCVDETNVVSYIDDRIESGGLVIQAQDEHVNER